MTYMEMYVLLYGLNKKSLGDKEAKEIAIKRVIDIYKDLHEGKEPETYDK